MLRLFILALTVVSSNEAFSQSHSYGGMVKNLSTESTGSVFPAVSPDSGDRTISISAGVVINELMQSNIDCLMVEHDFPDSWVELYNSSPKALNLRGMRMGLTEDPSLAFLFDVDTLMPPHGHIVVCCDKEGRGLHTDFRLESGKGAVYLFNSDDSIVDFITHRKMPAPGTVYGRVGDGSDEWQDELLPTPGTPNRGGSGFLLPDPVFSMDGCLLTEPVTVEITMPMGNYPADTRIHITFDGSEPSKESLSVKSLTLHIAKSTVVRARLMSSSGISPRSVTQSYIFPEHGSQLPVFSLVTDSSYIYGNLGICSPDSADGMRPNYEQEWRRPVNIEYFGGDGRRQLVNQLGETAVGGKASRKISPQKSLKLYAHKRFGKKRLKAPFWEDKPGVTGVKSLMLRNGGNQCNRSRIDDAFGQRLFGLHVDSLDYQAYTPVVCYINGEYKGVYGLRERSNDDFVESNYGLDDTEIDESTSMSSWQGAYSSLTDLYMKEGVTYKDLEEAMNMSEFINWLIAEAFAQNTDWPGNNVYIWRAKEGGKWNWVLKDLDRLGHEYDGDFLNYIFQENVETTSPYGINHRLMQVLMNFPEFRDTFISRFSVYLGDFLKPDVSRRLLERMRAEIENEIVPTHEAWGADATAYGRYFRRRLDFIWDECGERPARFYRQLARFFGLGDMIPVRVIQPYGGGVSMNGIRLTEGDFDGAWYSGYPLRLSSGNRELSWIMEVDYGDGETAVYKYDRPDISILLNDYSSGRAVSSVCIHTPLRDGSAVKTGDVNCDDRVDISDIVAVINIMAAADKYVPVADVNRDGSINISDIVAIISITAAGGGSCPTERPAGRTITVNKHGGKDFTSLLEGILEATKTLDSTVFVDGGVYDLEQEFKDYYGNSFFDDYTPASIRGIILKNRVRVVFDSGAKVVFNYEGGNEYVWSMFSPFNSGPYGFTLENLTLEASKCRYCIHDEREISEDHYINKYINCSLRLDNTGNNYWNHPEGKKHGFSQCIGGGLGKNGEIIVRNCEFESLDLPSRGTSIVSWHNSRHPEAKSSLVVCNNRFKGKSGFRLSWYGTSLKKTQALVFGNTFGKAIEHRAETESSTIQNTEIIEWNNSIKKW